MTTRPVPMFESAEASRPRFRYIDALYRMLEDYITEVNASELSATSKVDYIYFATCFVRWLHNDYTPGQGLS